MVLLIKFGKKEHLEQLKNGIVHFSPIELFQEDPTDFRGDKMEGKHYIDTSKPLAHFDAPKSTFTNNGGQS